MKDFRLIATLFIMILAAFSMKDSHAQNTTEQSVQEGNKKNYTYEEFRAAVNKEVENALVNLGRTRIVDFSKELLARDEALKVRELELKKKSEALVLTERELERKVKEFGSRQEKFLSCIDETDKKMNARVSHMVDVIAGMRPAEAAKILSVQDAGISVKILGLLEPVKVSKIFNLMEKEISARLQKQYMNMQK